MTKPRCALWGARSALPELPAARRGTSTTGRSDPRAPGSPSRSGRVVQRVHALAAEGWRDAGRARARRTRGGGDAARTASWRDGVRHGYSALVLDGGRAQSVFYVHEGELWGFGLLTPGLALPVDRPRFALHERARRAGSASEHGHAHRRPHRRVAVGRRRAESRKMSMTAPTASGPRSSPTPFVMIASPDDGAAVARRHELEEQAPGERHHGARRRRRPGRRAGVVPPVPLLREAPTSVSPSP